MAALLQLYFELEHNNYLQMEVEAQETQKESSCLVMWVVQLAALPKSVLSYY